MRMHGGRASSSKALDREELPRLDYATHLWMEKRIQSVANVARGDVAQFLELAAAGPALVPGEP
ncbi:MAG: hypothetical protein WAK57_17290 [Desulfobacterales bacterium]